MKNFTLVFLLLTLLSACSTNKYEPDTLRMNLGTEPPSLDWNLASDSNSFDIISNIMEGLGRFAQDADGKVIIVPGCAQSWEISPDGKEYIFHLDPNAKWTDGKIVEAQEFIDSFKRLLDPNTAAPYASLLSMIDLNGSTALDNQTLKVKLKYPASYFIYLTAHGITYPVRLDLIRKYGNDWTEAGKLITNGPYKLKTWQHEYKILLERNETYHHNKAKTKYLKYFMVPEQASAFTLYTNNQFDWIDNRSIPVSEHRRLKANSREQFPLLRNSFIGFNTQRKPFSEKLVRQAFAFAIDRKILCKIRSKNDIPNNTWIPPSLSELLDYAYLRSQFRTLFGEDFTLDGYHPELARRLLAQAGYPNGKNFPEIELLIPSRDDVKLQAETLQAMWAKELNVKVKINAMEWKVYLSTLEKNPPDLFRMSWGADYPDPDTFMQLFTKNNSFNHGRFNNPEYDALILKAGSIIDPQERKKLYSKAESILTIEETAIAPLFIDSQTILKKPWVKNLVITPMDLAFLDSVMIQ